MGPDDNKKLSNEAAEALLTAIQDMAPKGNAASLESLANAYAAVVGAMPRPVGRVGSTR